MLQLLESACESLEKSRTFCHKPRLAALMASGGSCLWGVEPRGARSHCILGSGCLIAGTPGACVRLGSQCGLFHLGACGGALSPLHAPLLLL